MAAPADTSGQLHGPSEDGTASQPVRSNKHTIHKHEGQDATLAAAFDMLTQLVKSRQEEPVWKVANQLPLDAFHTQEHDATAWCSHFTAAVIDQQVKPEHIWLCFVQNIVDPIVLTWAAGQPPHIRESLDKLKVAFLDEFGRMPHQQDRAQWELYHAQQRTEEHPHDFCHCMVQDFC